MREIHRKLLQCAEAHGFSAGYFLSPADLAPVWRAQCHFMPPPHTRNLCLSPSGDYPWASCVFLLVRAYSPFAPGDRFPAYYPASNAGYHAANALKEELAAMQYRAERVEVPLSALVMREQIGLLLKNALLELPGFGTRTALYTILTDACAPCAYPPAALMPCGACALCAKACPFGAIDTVHGLDAQRCVRTYMESEPMPDWVMERMPGLLGCEICQGACPRNGNIPLGAPSAFERASLDLERLLHGDSKDARALVGKNLVGRGRLQAQAAVLLAQDGRRDLLPVFEALLSSPHEIVRGAARWALRTLRTP